MHNLIRSSIIFFVIIICLSQFGSACTVFHASNDSFAFGGNNEDWNDSDTYIYFYPPTEDSYGKAIVGYSGSYKIQGGVNEKGLFWDGLAAPYLEVINSNGKPYFNGHIFDYILDTCKSCDEALVLLDQYNMKILENAQIIIGDQYGDSFIIEGDVVHRKSDFFQVATNFYLSEHPNPPYPCWRYNTALDMFENKQASELSLDFCTAVLDAVHQEGSYPTQYSTIYDLKNGLIHLYHNHNYEKVKIFNLTAEFSLGYHAYEIPALFEQESHPPLVPIAPIGPIDGKAGIRYDYTTHAQDPDDDDIYYLFDWGDGTDSGWIGPYHSGEECRASHHWSEQNAYDIKVKARDIYDFESDWSESLHITMPKNKSFNHFFFNIFNLHPLINLLFKTVINK